MSYYADYIQSLKIGEEVDYENFYRDIFDTRGSGLPDERERYDKNQYLGIVLTVFPDGKIRKKLFDATLRPVVDLVEHPMQGTTSFLSPISYAGKAKSGKNARWMFALCIEIDDLLEDNGRFTGLDHLIESWQEGDIPKPTYLIASGNGVHLYYQFVEKLPLYKPNQSKLMNLRRELTKKLWGAGLSTSKVQIEGLVQGFRVVGSVTKSGKICRAFRIGEKITLDYLNSFVEAEFRATELQTGPLHCSREEAQKLYPDWWAEQQAKKKKLKEIGPGHYVYNRALYDNWKKRLYSECEVGHRAGGMMTLAIAALKCDIEEDELIADIEDLSKHFDSLSVNDNNRFTVEEGLQALRYYHDPSYYTYPLSSVAYRSGIEIEPTKRNYLPRAEHLKKCRELAARTNSRREIIREWRKNHPDGIKADCVRDTGCDKKTVSKWWEVCLDRRKTLKSENKAVPKVKYCEACGRDVPYERKSGFHYSQKNHFVYEYINFICPECRQKIGGYARKTGTMLRNKQDFDYTFGGKKLYPFWDDYDNDTEENE